MYQALLWRVLGFPRDEPRLRWRQCISGIQVTDPPAEPGATPTHREMKAESGARHDGVEKAIRPLGSRLQASSHAGHGSDSYLLADCSLSMIGGCDTLTMPAKEPIGEKEGLPFRYLHPVVCSSLLSQATAALSNVCPCFSA